MALEDILCVWWGIFDTSQILSYSSNSDAILGILFYFILIIFKVFEITFLRWEDGILRIS